MYINQVIKYKPPFYFLAQLKLCYAISIYIVCLRHKMYTGLYATCTCIVCYISRYTIVHVCIIHLRSPDVHHRYPGYSIATLGYNATYIVHVFIVIIHFRSSNVHHSYPGFFIAMPCYAMLQCYIFIVIIHFRSSNVHRHYPGYSIAMLQCYTYIFVIHFLSSNVHPCYPGYSISMLC